MARTTIIDGFDNSDILKRNPEHIKCWLVYSREWNAFWRPSRSGYTNDISQAGRYTAEDAAKHCTARDMQGDGSPSEFAMIAPETADQMSDMLGAMNLAKSALNNSLRSDGISVAGFNAIRKQTREAWQAVNTAIAKATCDRLS